MVDSQIRVYPEKIILAYVQKYITDDYEYKTNDKGHWINIPSPFYHDKRRRLGFNLDTGIVFDFKFQRPTDFEGFITKHQKEVMNNTDFTRQNALEMLFKIRMQLKKQGFKISPAVRKKVEEEGAQKLPSLSLEDITQPFYLFYL